ncbi:TRAP transporter small permease [Thermodesulfobacteriota bacterium]
MKKIIKFIGILSSKLESIAKVLSIMAIIGMLIVIILQIVARYIFASPPTWTEEVGKLLMIWGGLLGTSIAFKRRADIVLYNPSDKKGLVDILRRVIRFSAVLMFTGVILYYSPGFISRSLAVDFFGIQGVSVIWATAAVPCFIALIFIHNLAQLLQKHKKEPKT